MPELKPKLEPRKISIIQILNFVLSLWNYKIFQSFVIVIGLLIVFLLGAYGPKTISKLLNAKEISKEISSEKIQVRITDEKGNVIIENNLQTVLVNIYSNIIDLKARFQIDGKSEVGNVSQYIRDEVNRLTPQ